MLPCFSGIPLDTLRGYQTATAAGSPLAFATSAGQTIQQPALYAAQLQAIAQQQQAAQLAVAAAAQQQQQQQQNLIGGIKVSVMLQEEDGIEVEHWVGSISGITDSLRRKMTVLNEEGKPTLNPEYLGRVMTVTGQDVSSVNLRLSHCRATSWVFRTDKNMSDCTLTREFLMSQIL